MKKRVLGGLFALILIVSAATLCLAGKEVMNFKVGDEVYACNCGEGCNCNTLSLASGKCSCGNDLVKARVTSISDGKAMLMAEGWAAERPFLTVGKYACDCPPGCKCDTISQKPGKCACGKEMKKM